MSRIALALVAGLSGAVLVAALAGGVAGGGGAAASAGDANGDGDVDIADALYTLMYLFKGGSPPAACAASQDLEARVAALEERRYGPLAVISGVRLRISDCDPFCRTYIEQDWPSWPPLIRGCTVEPDAIRFSTSRDARLLFEMVLEDLDGDESDAGWAPPVFYLAVDDGLDVMTVLDTNLCCHATGSSVGQFRRVGIWPVLAGDHVLMIRGGGPATVRMPLFTIRELD